MSRRLEEYKAGLKLVHCPGIGPRTWKGLLLHFGSAVAAEQGVQDWTALGLARAGQVSSFLGEAWREKAEEEFRLLSSRNDQLLLWIDAGYPEWLRQIPDPPLMLYMQGNTRLLQTPCVAIVGARNCTRYGLEMATSIAGDLSRSGITVVSGFAWGIDRQAHLAAVDHAGSSIAVLGTGLDMVYPARNRDLWKKLDAQGLILTEYPPGTRPDAQNFPRRNRIISGLSLGILVVEAEVKSGSLITARMGLEQNREVFALPGPATARTFQGCHQLIREGATLVRSAEDILLELQPRLEQMNMSSCAIHSGSEPDPQIKDLEDGERILMEFIQRRERVHIDAMSQDLGLDSATVSQRLLMLELKNLVAKHPGMYYSLRQ
ncbi:MAG: DNA-processing protein DprA [Desulfovibrionales bacterium]